jgi:putative transposase
MAIVKEDTSARRHELTDTQWAKIQQLLPGKKSDPGRTAADNRLFVRGRLRA